MDDKEYESLKAEIEEFLGRWVDLLHLDRWKIKAEYDREGFSDGEEAPGVGTAGKCRANWRYEYATIHFNMPVMAECDDREYVVIHELQHILVNETRSNGDDWLDHEERVVHRLARAFRNVLRAQ